MKDKEFFQIVDARLHKYEKVEGDTSTLEDMLYAALVEAKARLKDRPEREYQYGYIIPEAPDTVAYLETDKDPFTAYNLPAGWRRVKRLRAQRPGEWQFE